MLEGRAVAGEGGSVALVARAGQGVKEPVRGGDPADRGGAVRRGGVASRSLRNSAWTLT